MNCHRAKMLLVPFLEAELSGKQKEEVKAHLKICTACHKEKELLSQSWQLLDSYVPPKLKDDFTSSLMRKIHSEQILAVKVSKKLTQFRFRLLAPALALLFMVIGFFFWKEARDDQRPAIITSHSHRETVYVVTDQEIVMNLDLYENAELLENLDLLTELDVIKKIDDQTLLQ